MKRRPYILALCLAMILCLVASCGKKPDENGSAAGGAETPAAEEGFVEEEPAKNALDPANPIPGVNREYALTEQAFPEENLILRLPEGVTAVNEGRDENMGHITVTDEENGWKLMFRPKNFSIDNIVNNVSGTAIYDGNPIKTDWSQDVSGTLAGFPVRVWANNTRKGWLNPSNESDAPGVDIVMDYGETLVGEWLGMHIRLEALDPQEDTNIYHYLYNSKLRAVLGNFECVRTEGGDALTVNGITVSVPSRWPVKTGENSLVALMQSSSFSGGITFSTQYNPDPQHHVDSYEGEQFTRTYGENDWKGVIAKHTFEKEDGSDPTILHSMYLFSEFNEKMSACVHVSSNSWGPEDYKTFLDDETFSALMDSVHLDPAGWHQPGTAEVNGLLSSSGRIMSYSGSDAEVEIPEMIGEYNTVFIGPDAFSGNTSLKKVVIPEGVTEIQPNAFSGCTNLETVVLPETLTYVYQNAFRDCPNLKDVTLPNNVVYVGNSAYRDAGTGTFTGSSAVYDSNAFSGSGFDKIVLGTGSDVSADYVFDGAALSEIELPEGLAAIGKGAFTGCRNLKTIRLPESVRSLGESAFSNMSGLVSVNLPEGITEIPANCFNSTTLDVLVIPSTVTKIGDYATYGASCIILPNPAVEIGTRAIQADFVYLTNAAEHVFPSDHQEMEGSCLYLDGVYDPATQLQGDFYNATSFSFQVFVPADATYDESDALDAYLASVGFNQIAWIGASREFLPESSYDFEVEGRTITAYHGESTKLAIPYYHLYEDDGWWLTDNVYGIADGAFKDSEFTAAYFRGQLVGSVGSRILEGNTALKDIWFTTTIRNELHESDSNGKTYYQADTFAGIPDDVTVHLPASIPEADRAALEEELRGIGIPAGASFDYYSLRD